MVRRPLPKKGCFKASYPSTDWQETTCTKAPEKPYLPAKGTPPEKVGNGHDFSAHVTGIITTAEGSFTSATGLTSDSDTRRTERLRAAAEHGALQLTRLQ